MSSKASPAQQTDTHATADHQQQNQTEETPATPSAALRRVPLLGTQDVRQLQRTLGNQGVQRLLTGVPLQSRLQRRDRPAPARLADRLPEPRSSANRPARRSPPAHGIPSSGPPIQAKWVEYDSEDIYVWDSMISGLHWFVNIEDDTMYFTIGDLNVVQQEFGKLRAKEYEKQAGREQSRAREEWVNTLDFVDGDWDKAEAEVINIRDATRRVSAPEQSNLESDLDFIDDIDFQQPLQQDLVQVRPLYEIINDVAKELQFTSVFDLEIRLSEPELYISAIVGSMPEQESDIEKIDKNDLLTRENMKESWKMQEYTFKDVYDHFVTGRMLRNSCGQTSNWIQYITSESGADLSEKPLLPDDFIKMLKSASGQHWFCRVSVGPHSFTIEKYDGKMYIYQSWHGAFALGHVLVDGIKEWSPDELIQNLDDALRSKDPNKQDQASRDLFNNKPLGDPASMIWFNMNMSPASPKAIKESIIKSLNKYKGMWDQYLKNDMKMYQWQEQMMKQQGQYGKQNQESGNEVENQRPETLQNMGFSKNIQDKQLMKSLKAIKDEQSYIDLEKEKDAPKVVDKLLEMLPVHITMRFSNASVEDMKAMMRKDESIINKKEFIHKDNGGKYVLTGYSNGKAVFTLVS